MSCAQPTPGRSIGFALELQDLNCRHYAAQKMVGLKWGNMILTHATQVIKWLDEVKAIKHNKFLINYILKIIISRAATEEIGEEERDM